MSKTLRIPPFLTRYQLVNARVPISVSAAHGLVPDEDGLAPASLLLEDGRIEAIKAGTAAIEAATPLFDLGGGIVLPTFTDAHTHLDKGHIWPRRRNPDGSFASALLACRSDRETLERRRTSRPHGVRAAMRLRARHRGAAHAYRFDVAADRDLLAGVRRDARRLAGPHRAARLSLFPSSSRSTTNCIREHREVAVRRIGRGSAP